MKHIVINARRWFQRTYGNTYFTADISVDGQHVHKLPRQYGYGDHYLDIAADWLESNGHISRDHHANGSSTPLWQLRDKGEISLVYSASDVGREKDL